MKCSKIITATIVKL